MVCLVCYNRGPDLHDDGTDDGGNVTDDESGPSTSAVHRKERTPQQVQFSYLARRDVHPIFCIYSSSESMLNFQYQTLKAGPHFQCKHKHKHKHMTLISMSIMSSLEITAT